MKKAKPFRRADEDCFWQVANAMSRYFSIDCSDSISPTISGLVGHLSSHGVNHLVNYPLEACLSIGAVRQIGYWVRAKTLADRHLLEPKSVVVLYSSAYELYSIEQVWTHYVAAFSEEHPRVFDPWPEAPFELSKNSVLCSRRIRGVRMLFWLDSGGKAA